jgi:dihydroorotate dehydrogenase electron transfer subunit
MPGQFFTFLPEASEPGDSGLLRRPLAFSAFSEPFAFSLYQGRGSATRALAKKRAGSSINIIGPLGNGFPAPEKTEKAYTAGGGIGIGPILFHAARLMEFGNAPDSELILGFSSISEVPNFKSLDDHIDGKSAKSGIEAMEECVSHATISADDGSALFRGTAVEALNALLERDSVAGGVARAPEKRPHLYACGPRPMLSALAALAARKNLPAHFSAEQWMACGVGACYGCVVPTTDGSYLRVCADGPVFESRQILWVERP